MKLKKLTSDEVAFSFSVEPDDIPVKGNALASGDDAADKEAEDAILDRLDRGDELAWCIIVVEAKWQGYRGIASLGGNTLADSAEVESTIKEHDMYTEALDNLNTALERELRTLSERIEV